MKKFRVSGTIYMYVDQEVFAEDEDGAMDQVHSSYCAENSDLEAELIEGDE